MFNKIQLPQIFADESLYSWTSRYHQLSFHHNSKVTSKILFGSNTSGLRIDFPSNLNYFANNTNGSLGSANYLLHHHTNFSFYEKFLKPSSAKEIANSFLNGQNSQARAKLALNKFPPEFLNILKTCPECNAHQLQSHPSGYWITQHQYPSSFTCNIHQTALNIFDVPSYRGCAINFHLPNDSYKNSTFNKQINNPNISKHLINISHWGYWIIEQDFTLSDEILRWCYLYHSFKNNFLSFDGSLRGGQLRDAFVNYYGNEAINFFGPKLVGDLYDANFGFIANLFRKYSSGRHPLKHILLINFLFESFDDFLKVYIEVSTDLLHGTKTCDEKIKANQKDLIKLIRQEGQSLNKIVQSLNTSVTSAAKFLDKEKIVREKRPRVINTPLEGRLNEMLLKGASRAEITHTLNLKKSFIKDYLAKNQPLKSQWEVAYKKIQTDAHRNQLLTALNNHPNLPIKAIRRLPNNGFQWLYKHDIHWLIEILPAIWKRS